MANFPLINEASLVMASGAYKEGKIYSQLPTDGSGDFTFTRGTDTATRVNKDGYIEKERVNLLTQSNSFDTSPWILNPSYYNLTGNQTGYDGSSDAWLLDKLTLDNQYLRNQTLSTDSVYTASIYAKANTADSVMIYLPGGYATFRLTQGGAVVSSGSQPIDTKIKDLGNGWFRCSVTGTGSQSQYFIQPKNETGAYTIGSIYIQDGQVNNGLVATDYIETTTAPVYAGITDNMPRLDYSGGAECGAYLLEPSRTNSIGYSEYLNGIAGWFGGSLTFGYDSSILNPEGYYGCTNTLTDGLTRTITKNGISVGTKISYSIFAKSDSNANFNFGSLVTDEWATFNILTGALISQGSSIDSAYSIEYPNGWRRYIVVSNFTNTIGNNAIYTQLRWYDSTTPAYLYGLQVEVDAAYPTSYIPTYGSPQTRAADVSTLSKTLPSEGSLFINVGGTSQPKLSVLGEYFDASTTANKVAIAYSSTALVISHNGSIVVDKTGTYDVSSLTQIQLGHSNGADQADSPISEFVTFDSFLTNNELNALTQ